MHFVRAVDEYRVEPWGLYMARTSDHRQFHYLESWIIPRLGIRASIFHYHPEHRRDQDFYVDIGEFTSGAVWRSIDHYLDLVVRTGREVELLDVDEIGIELTEGMAMWPGASVSGWYFSHPSSQYFVVGRVGKDQVEDYARRKGWDLATTERWLSPILNYDPARYLKAAAE